MLASVGGPANETRQLRVTIIFVCVVQVLASMYEMSRGNVVTISIAALTLVAAFGLYRRLRWGHLMSTGFLWLLLLIGIGLMLPARLEGDAITGGESPSVLIAGMQAAAICGTALILLHFLGKHKSSFRMEWL